MRSLNVARNFSVPQVEMVLH